MSALHKFNYSRHVANGSQWMWGRLPYRTCSDCRILPLPEWSIKKGGGDIFKSFRFNWRAKKGAAEVVKGVCVWRGGSLCAQGFFAVTKKGGGRGWCPNKIVAEKRIG